MVVRAILFLVLAILVFLPFNWLTWRQMSRIHPRRRKLIAAVMVIGNLMWPFFLQLRSLTPFSRGVRAVLGPPWFAWTVFAIVYSAVILLTLLIWLPFRKRTTFENFARWPSSLFVIAVIVGSIIGFYQALVPLRVERVTIPIRGLPPSAEGKRIALLSDLHVGLFTRPARLETIFTTTDGLAPDVVLLAGDLIDDDPFFVSKLATGFDRVRPSIPLVGVLGNHEMYGDPVAAVNKLRATRMRLLVNEGLDTGALWIAGISDYAAGDVPEAARFKPDLGRALAQRPADRFPVVVAHQPRVFAEARQRGLPLSLVGHTHGGQLGFRPLRWSLAGVFLPFHMGLYERGASKLYVNTGTGYWLVPFRLGMTPEITLIELRRE